MGKNNSHSPWPVRINNKVVTPREWDMMHSLVFDKDKSNKAIAHKYGLTEGTIKVVISRMFSKLNLNRFTLSMYFYRDHQRQQAVKLHQWIRKHERELKSESLEEIQDILSSMVVDYLKEEGRENV